jgi:hypothetical protein
MPSNKTWGEIFGVAGLVTATPFGLVGGILKAADGGSFYDGFAVVVAPAIELGTEFGEKHGQTVEKAVVKTAVFIVVGGAVDATDDAFHDHPPDKPGA